MAIANVVVNAIMQAASDAHVRQAMLMGAKLESGWNQNAVGDNGSSFGAFQIHLPAHPGVSAAQASDPVFAANYMKGAYAGGVSKVPVGLWASDPAQASALAAFYAERPAAMYPASRYRAAWPDVLNAMNGNAAAGPITGISNPVTDVATKVTDFLLDMDNRAVMGLIMVGGLLMMTVGIVLVVKETREGRQAGKVVRTVSGLVPGVGKVVGKGGRRSAAKVKIRETVPTTGESDSNE